ncbi:hypothetical protein VNO78_01363 [Psophocarpus tetragonolobus]|uniref:Uncharacterized protein n=1 Tax=Psophocarpus tetragonolobus TaxID=3891 RepID=A0AAN9XV55_PSOTE
MEGWLFCKRERVIIKVGAWLGSRRESLMVAHGWDVDGEDGRGKIHGVEGRYGGGHRGNDNCANGPDRIDICACNTNDIICSDDLDYS